MVSKLDRIKNGIKRHKWDIFGTVTLVGSYLIDLIGIPGEIGRILKESSFKVSAGPFESSVENILGKDVLNKEINNYVNQSAVSRLVNPFEHIDTGVYAGGSIIEHKKKEDPRDKWYKVGKYTKWASLYIRVARKSYEWWVFHNSHGKEIVYDITSKLSGELTLEKIAEVTRDSLPDMFSKVLPKVYPTVSVPSIPIGWDILPYVMIFFLIVFAIGGILYRRGEKEWEETW